jgi:hypothetical protein
MPHPSWPVVRWMAKIFERRARVTFVFPDFGEDMRETARWSPQSRTYEPLPCPLLMKAWGLA